MRRWLFATVCVSALLGAQALAAPRVDFNGDGKSDLVWRNNANGQTMIRLMNGLSTTSSAVVMTDAHWAVTNVGDFNGDLKTDLLWRHSTTGEIAMWLMNGTTFIGGGSVSADPNWVVTHTGDFDGDGKTDLLVRNSATGQTAIWLMNGRSVVSATTINTDSAWRVTHVGDFNGDGKTDLVWRNSVTGATAIWLMNGATFNGGAGILTDPSWSVTHVADFDGDGQSDLVLRNSSTGETAIWIMHGVSFAGGGTILAHLNWVVTNVGDFNGDGKADLIWRNGSTGETVMWLMNGTTFIGGASIFTDANWVVTHTGDFNGDGKTDLVWRNSVTGQTSMWLMNGVTATSSAYILSDSNWSVIPIGDAAVTTANIPPTVEAARLLQQGTWGVTLAEINRVARIGADAWLNEQFAAPAASYTVYAQQNIEANKHGANGCPAAENGCPWQVNFPAFYKQAFEGNDQLRQRVVNALLEMIVISIANGRLEDAGTAMPNYLDMLGSHAFGNYRNLLRDVTLHPGMGVYLDMLGSSLEQPNENYAREALQLFSIGTVLLNDDGTPQRDARGQTISTYGQDIVKGFAKAFTGWHFSNQDMTQSWKFYWPDQNWTVPMMPWTARRCPQDGHWPPGSTTTWCDPNDPASSYPPPHDTSTKTLLQYPGAPYANLPAGQTPQADLENAVDNIFNHPNVGPFVARQLIQRLVTSNPTPAYVQRVARVFNNNGSNVRGDMKAIVRAILLDNEARSATVAAGNTFGKLREPVHKFLQLHRAFNAQSSSHYYAIWDLSDPEQLGQAPIRAPSVFNYFGAGFSPSGPIGQAGLVGPEFEITTTSAVAGFSEFTNWAVVGGFGQYDSDPSLWIKPDYDRYLVGTVALADNPQAMVDELDLLLTAGNLKAQFKSDLVAVLNLVTRDVSADQRRDRFRIAMWQIIHSAEYAVQR
jgi:uncharacterized protein (DUF1800 family)